MRRAFNNSDIAYRYSNQTIHMKRNIYQNIIPLILLLCLSLFGASTSVAQNVSVVTFDDTHQRFGGGFDTRTVQDTFQLPASLEGFNQILMHVELSCPPGGCDPWDRFAAISLQKENEWLEIGRYMTPYRKACGWDIDVTDYSTLLTGEVVLRSFIDTWVNPAWLVKVTFEYVEGTEGIPLTQVENVWQNYGLVYGDTTQLSTLPVADPVIAAAIDSVKLKVVITGHGQGNTNNAAEFSQKTHEVYVDGSSAFSHYLWRSDCNSNSCSPQSGSWQYNRAGWCPGADVEPAYFNLTSLVTPGSAIELDYRLASYFNQCSPNNPDCSTNNNCPDCDYNYNGHTQPYYAISGQLITFRGVAASVNELNARSIFAIVPNPVGDSDNLTVKLLSGNRNSILSVYNLLGEQVCASQVLTQTSTVLQLNAEAGVYIVVLEEGQQRYVQKLVIQ